MIENPSTGSPATAYRGFLFSDVRGFTAFAERHGNAAAADMVAGFLELARRSIARHQGTEVGTEGDAIHAVFPSASRAVLCGLDIVEGAAELSAKEPDRPLGLGVGIHAGEAVETAEGYIGRAVNIAARLCAAAKPGEVLVSSTVKGITQASIPVGFIPRGRRRLKGIADPILVYAVSRDPNAKAPFEVPRGLIAAGAASAAVLALAVIVAFAGPLLFGSPAAQASPSPDAKASATALPAAPTAQPLVMGPVQIGSYATRQFQPAFFFDVGDLGWQASRDVPELVGLLREDAPRGSLYFARVREVIAMPCTQGGDGGEGATGPAATDVVAQLQGLDHLDVMDVEPVVVGGAPGQQMTVTVSEAALAACGGIAGADVALFRAGDEVLGASPGERFQLIVVSVGADAVTIMLSLDWTETHSVQELEDMLEYGQNIIETVEFAAAPPA